MVFRIKLALIGCGGVLMFLGFQEWQLSTQAQATPKSISCRQLAEQGPGDNAHVILTDFMFSEGGYVVEEAKSGNDWKSVWVPTVPFELHYNEEEGTAEVNPDTGPVRVIVKSSRVDNESELGQLNDQETIQGVVINKIQSLGGEEKKLLQESYPGIDFSTCWIVEHARLPASTGKIAAMGVGGLILLLAGGGWMLAGRRA